MSRLANLIGRFIDEECGPTTVEYAVMLALIVVVSIVAVASIGQKIDTTYATLSANLPTGQ